MNELIRGNDDYSHFSLILFGVKIYKRKLHHFSTVFHMSADCFFHDELRIQLYTNHYF